VPALFCPQRQWGRGWPQQEKLAPLIDKRGVQVSREWSLCVISARDKRKLKEKIYKHESSEAHKKRRKR